MTKGELIEPYGTVDECTKEEGDIMTRDILDLLQEDTSWRHEAAEESIVHPTLRDEVPDGQDIVAEVLEEEAEAESLMAKMESLDPTSTEFFEKFRTLRDDVLNHAEHEEKEEFPRLREHLSEEQRREWSRVAACHGLPPSLEPPNGGHGEPERRSPACSIGHYRSTPTSPPVVVPPALGPGRT